MSFCPVPIQYSIYFGATRYCVFLPRLSQCHQGDIHRVIITCGSPMQLVVRQNEAGSLLPIPTSGIIPSSEPVIATQLLRLHRTALAAFALHPLGVYLALILLRPSLADGRGGMVVKGRRNHGRVGSRNPECTRTRAIVARSFHSLFSFTDFRPDGYSN